MANNYPTISVEKVEIFKKLCGAGILPGNRSSDYERLVRECIHESRPALNETKCSVSTNLEIAKEAEKLDRLIKYHWKKGHSHKNYVENKLSGDITIELVPEFHEIPDLAPSTSGGAGRRSGPYKTYEEKGSRAQSLDIAAVRQHHAPGAILGAAPAAASELGEKEMATAFRKIAKDPKVNSELAMEGMKNQSMY